MWTGMMPAVTSKFTADGALDRAEMERCFALQIEAGNAGLITCGTLGEGNMLSQDERIEVLKIAKSVTGRKPALMTISEPGTREACALAGRAAKAGADGLMVVPSPIYHTNRDETIANLNAVANAGGLPVMIYSNRVGYRVDVTPEMMVELAENPLMVAIKESSDDIRRCTEIFNTVGNRFKVLTGVDNLGLEALLMGCDGWVSGVSIAFPKENQAIYDLVQAGRIEEALVDLPLVQAAARSRRLDLPRPADQACRGNCHRLDRACPRAADAADRRAPGAGRKARARADRLPPRSAEDRASGLKKGRAGFRQGRLNMVEIIVIGGGIIGLTAAFRLAEAGRKVLILDRRGPAEEASRNNAGAFAFADVEPIASPGIIWKAPFWLMDPLGPLAMPLSYAPKMLPWLWRFWRASRPARHETSTAAQARLMELAKAETEGFFAATGLAHHLRRDGAIYLYAGERALKAARGLWDLRARHGVGFETVSGARLADLQPGLDPKYSHGVFIPAWMTLSDPYEVACAIGRAACARGAAFETAEVADLSPDGQGVSVRLADGRRLSARTAVVACGRVVASACGAAGRLSCPLETERGYNTTLPPGGLRSEAPARASRPRLCHHAAVDRDPGRRRGRTGRSRSAHRTFAARRCHAEEGGRRSCPVSRPKAARNGWAFVRRCPTACR